MPTCNIKVKSTVYQGEIKDVSKKLLTRSRTSCGRPKNHASLAKASRVDRYLPRSLIDCLEAERPKGLPLARRWHPLGYTIEYTESGCVIYRLRDRDPVQ